MILSYQIACASPHAERDMAVTINLHEQKNLKDIFPKTLARIICLSELPTCLKRNRKETLTHKLSM